MCFWNRKLVKICCGWLADITSLKYCDKSCSDSRLDESLSALKHENVSFCFEVLDGKKVQIPKEDYRELMELTLIFLGETPPRGFRFRVQGTFLHARWMSKVLYVLKLFLFQGQFHLSKDESSACLEFSLFVTLIYVKAWISCPSSCDAPVNDLCLVKQLTDYKATSQVVAEAMDHHLWYLGQELIPLAMFSNSVSYETESRMASFLITTGQGEVDVERSVKYTGKDDLSDKTLDYFMGPASHFFFRALHIDTSFFSVDAEQWPEQKSYHDAKEIVQSLKVVNDSAKHCIALATDFNSSLTKREEEKQYLFHIIEQHRKQFPDTKKSTLSVDLKHKIDGFLKR